METSFRTTLNRCILTFSFIIVRAVWSYRLCPRDFDQAMSASSAGLVLHPDDRFRAEFLDSIDFQPGVGFRHVELPPFLRLLRVPRPVPRICG